MDAHTSCYLVYCHDDWSLRPFTSEHDSRSCPARQTLESSGAVGQWAAPKITELNADLLHRKGLSPAKREILGPARRRTVHVSACARLLVVLGAIPQCTNLFRLTPDASNVRGRQAAG